MSVPEKLRPLLVRAAELRAGGASWAAVADALKRRPDTCRRWPDLYPDFWRRALAAAERRLLTEAGAEAVAVLRQMLRNDDDKVRRDAARSLAALRARRRRRGKGDPRQPSTDGARLAEFLEGLTDAEVQALIAELSDPPAAAGGPLAPAGGGPGPDQSG